VSRLDIHIEQEADLTVVNARTHLMLLLPPYCCSGDLFFTDWSDMDMNVRMKYWDRKFKTLLSYPQVSLAQGGEGTCDGKKVLGPRGGGGLMYWDRKSKTLLSYPQVGLVVFYLLGGGVHVW
jgi:hypothetical protein